MAKSIVVRATWDEEARVWVATNYTKDVRALISAAGCIFVRQGRGDHEIWESPITGKRFPVDSAIKSRHTANEVLKQAGLDKAF